VLRALHETPAEGAAAAGTTLAVRKINIVSNHHRAASTPFHSLLPESLPPESLPPESHLRRLRGQSRRCGIRASRPTRAWAWAWGKPLVSSEHFDPHLCSSSLAGSSVHITACTVFGYGIGLPQLSVCLRLGPFLCSEKYQSPALACGFANGGKLKLRSSL
jgi:hypothetical protein